MRCAWACVPLLLLTAAAPTTSPTGKLPHIQIDVARKELRVECQAVKADYPLEFLAVVTNTNEYESLVHTQAKPSDLHLALLMLGLKPGQPVHFSATSQTWDPPTGPPVQIWFEYDKDGKHQKVPAYTWMRDVKTKTPADTFQWVFSGPPPMDNGTYIADSTGFLVSVINNPSTVLDVPAIKSRALEARQWERNPETMPPTDTPVTMILSPAPAPATQPAP